MRSRTRPLEAGQLTDHGVAQEGIMGVATFGHDRPGGRVFTHPVSAESGSWAPEARPPDWMRLRGRWTKQHAARWLGSHRAERPDFGFCQRSGS